MEDEKIENIDSPNDAEDTEKVNEDKSADDKSEDTEGKDKPQYSDNEKKLYARMKNAEAKAKLAEDELAKSKSSGKPTPAGDLDKILDAKFEKRELESLDLSDELKKEIQTYAKVQGVSVKKALSSEYISFLKEKEEKKERIDNASLGSKRRGNIKKDYSEMTVSDFDLKTPEGKADFAKYEEYIRQQLG